MGSYISHQPDNSNIAKIVQDLEKTRIEREIAFAQLLERRKLAYKIAEEREKFNWSACAGGLVIALSAMSSLHHKNLLHVIPMFPVASYLGYKAHFCYGDQLKRINESANAFLEDNSDNLVPLPPSIADIKKRAKQLKQLADDEVY
ncbi:unnamed protein product [Caenorhabditis angaria]|uniref:Uncharacterized protein n=1 Tax=Caenorhabditis angaria TaxID=860376 RepID=A0A9P1IC58_9PELO|nr:unnamed protein product [Caenorhabditis angaria]